jgi:4'-phosphopantetheinyl transferase
VAVRGPALALLSAEEKARYGRFYFDRDREVFMAAHALKRSLLSRYLSCGPDELSFEVGEYGRPELRGSTGLRFNLTHTQGLVACVIHDERDCGVDAEWRGRTPNLPALTKRCFVPAEAEGIDAQPDPLRRFFELWTLKESYIKARGMGMTLPLRGFWFTGEGSPALGFGARSDVETSPGAWRFELFEPTEEHQVAVALWVGERDAGANAIRCRPFSPSSLGL